MKQRNESPLPRNTDRDDKEKVDHGGGGAGEHIYIYMYIYRCIYIYMYKCVFWFRGKQRNTSPLLARSSSREVRISLCQLVSVYFSRGTESPNQKRGEKGT